MAKIPLATFAVVFALAAGALSAQDTEPPTDPTLPDRLKELKSYVGDRKMEQDFQAIGLIQNLAKDLDQKNDKDKKRLAKGLGDVFTTGKVREGGQDILYREAADALAKLGEDGAKELSKVVDHRRFEDNLRLVAHMILALGRTKDPKQIDWLLETTTRSHQDELRAAAGEALGNFTDADLRQKREIVKDIIREWGGLHQQATTPDPIDPNAPIDFGPQNARRILRAVEGKWVATLQKLTGVSQTEFADWQRWLNKNPRWEPPQ